MVLSRVPEALGHTWVWAGTRGGRRQAGGSGDLQRSRGLCLALYPGISPPLSSTGTSIPAAQEAWLLVHRPGAARPGPAPFAMGNGEMASAEQSRLTSRGGSAWGFETPGPGRLRLGIQHGGVPAPWGASLALPQAGPGGGGMGCFPRVWFSLRFG